MARHAGLLLPLFSARTRTDWGVGEIGSIGVLAGWMRHAGLDRLMLLPVGTVTAGETSPYSAASAMAIDPMYISLSGQEDFTRLGGEAALPDEDRDVLDAVRRSSTVAYEAARGVKGRALARIFDSFLTDEWQAGTMRAAALAAYIAQERWWLDDYALHQALSAEAPHTWWREWTPALRDRDAAALDETRRRLALDVLKHQYWQWLAESQWQRTRAAANRQGVAIFGDLPFMVSASSADVWARQQEFDVDVSVGVPPDAFSEDGQDWGLPMYRWDVMAADDFAWIRQRIRRMTALFDGLRVDHLVGFYRTYARPPGGEAFFSPAEEPEQLAQGERLMRLFQASGAAIVAEDLGTVPDFVRDSLRRLDIPGCKVLRWERDWHAEGQPFIDPGLYAPVSAAMTGTHDTEPQADWWEVTDVGTRTAAVRLPVLQAHAIDVDAPWSDRVRDALLEQAYAAGSEELFLPVQDLFGWRDRINTPGTVSDRNWTWRLSWPLDDWLSRPETAERAAFSRHLAVRSGRLNAGEP